MKANATYPTKTRPIKLAADMTAINVEPWVAERPK